MNYKILHLITLTGILLSVSAFTTLPAKNCGAMPGTVIDVEIPSTILEESIDAKVYLPACYDAEDKHYPTLYLLHGMDNVAEQWVSLGATSTADQMPTQFIIVMPHDRMESSFNTAFVNEVVPFIDENFRTIDERDYRAIGGLSYGGGWALHIGLSHAELFSRISGHSPALFYGDSPNIEFWAQQLPAHTFISIDIGENDPLLANSALVFDTLITQAGATHLFTLNGGGHTEDYWATHLPEYLEFYTQGW